MSTKRFPSQPTSWPCYAPAPTGGWLRALGGVLLCLLVLPSLGFGQNRLLPVPELVLAPGEVYVPSGQEGALLCASRAKNRLWFPGLRYGWQSRFDRESLLYEHEPTACCSHPQALATQPCFAGYPWPTAHTTVPNPAGMRLEETWQSLDARVQAKPTELLPEPTLVHTEPEPIGSHFACWRNESDSWLNLRYPQDEQPSLDTKASSTNLTSFTDTPLLPELAHTQRENSIQPAYASLEIGEMLGWGSYDALSMTIVRDLHRQSRLATTTQQVAPAAPLPILADLELPPSLEPIPHRPNKLRRLLLTTALNMMLLSLIWSWYCYRQHRQGRAQRST